MRGHDWGAIREKYPLTEIVGHDVALKRAGREWKGCCPFHNEKSASFTIFDDGQRFHCFGCGASGDVIDYVSRHEGISAADAVARLTGGAAPKLTAQDATAREAWRAEQDAARAKQSADATAKASAAWHSAHAIDGAHPYLDRKGIAPHMARAKAGKLILPIYDADGEIMSVQTIAPDGAKRFFPDAPVMGGRVYIGINMGRTIICEGFATGASIYEAVPDQVCIAYSKLNMTRIAREMAELGRDIMLASDSGCADEMRELAAELDCPVAAPPQTHSDFNDMAQADGTDAVRAVFSEALLAHQQRPEPPEPEPFCAIDFADAIDFNEQDIPVRPWLVPGALLAGATHILAAPGGTGKSLLTLQFAIMLASGKPWGQWRPKRPCKVMVVNAEDDIDEQRRRISAARQVMDAGGYAIPKGGILVADNPSSILTADVDEKTKRLVSTPLVSQLVAMIRHHAIDVVIVDPFAETFSGDENSNNDAKWAMKIWRDDIARATGCAVYLVHHTVKGAGNGAGSADVIRGAGALVNSARLASTLFVMTEDEAESLGVDPEQRYRYVRYDDAKSNQSLVGARSWFEKISVVIGNGPEGSSDGGDEVGALRPWSPAGLETLPKERLAAILDAIDTGYIDSDGVCTDLPFTPNTRGNGARWVGALLMDMVGIEENAAKRMFRAMMDGGMVELRDYINPQNRRTAKGVYVIREGEE